MKIANILTVSRIVLAPIILVLILYKIWAAAIILLAAAFLTDIFDGYLARKLKQESHFGKVLDPVADKMLAFCAIFGLLYVFGKAETNWIYGIMFFSKDILNFAFLIFKNAYRLKKIHPRPLGKITSVFQAITLFWIILGLPNDLMWIYLVFFLTQQSLLTSNG